MAVDTRQKRFSMMHLQAQVATLPVPDGSLATAADRRQLLRLYSGELAAVTVPAGFVYISDVSIAIGRAVGTIQA